MRLPVVYIIIAVAALTVSTAQAEKLYKWTGKDGKVSYQDKPPPEDEGVVQEKNLSGNARGTSDAGTSEAAQKFPVILYSTTKCSPCDQARAYLKKRKVPFAEKNVSNNQPLQKEMIEKIGELSVPTLMIGSKVMKGYIESLLEGELDQAGYPKEGKNVAGEGSPEAQDEVPAQESPAP